MSELLNGIFECLDINSSTGLASEDSLRSMTPFQRLFYTQVHKKIGIDAVYFLRDANGIAKVPLIYFSIIQKYDAKEIAELHRLMRRARIIRLSILSTWLWMKCIRGKASIKIRPFLIHHAVRVFSWLRHTEGLSADGCPKMISIRSPVIN